MKKILTYFIAVAITSFLLTSCIPVNYLLNGGVNKYDYARETLDALLKAINNKDFSIIKPYFCTSMQESTKYDLEAEFKGLYEFLDYIVLDLPIEEDDLLIERSYDIIYEHSEFNEGIEDLLYAVPSVLVTKSGRCYTYIHIYSYLKHPNPDQIGIIGFAIRDLSNGVDDEISYQVGRGSNTNPNNNHGNVNYPPSETVPGDYWDFMR